MASTSPRSNHGKGQGHSRHEEGRERVVRRKDRQGSQVRCESVQQMQGARVGNFRQERLTRAEASAFTITARPFTIASTTNLAPIGIDIIPWVAHPARLTMLPTRGTSNRRIPFTKLLDGCGPAGAHPGLDVVQQLLNLMASVEVPSPRRLPMIGWSMHRHSPRANKIMQAPDYIFISHRDRHAPTTPRCTKMPFPLKQTRNPGNINIIHSITSRHARMSRHAHRT